MGHIARTRELRNATKLYLLVGEPGKRHFVRLRHRWVDNIKMGLKGIGYDCGLD
jgi:hypothetical protein